jgi:hypothetical protein
MDLSLQTLAKVERTSLLRQPGTVMVTVQDAAMSMSRTLSKQGTRMGSIAQLTRGGVPQDLRAALPGGGAGTRHLRVRHQ